MFRAIHFEGCDLFRREAVMKSLAMHGAAESEAGLIAEVLGPGRLIEKGRLVCQEGHERGQAYVLHRGWAMASKRMPDGTRQIINFRIPFDFLGLKSLFLGVAHRDIEAVTELLVSPIDNARFISLLEATPRLYEVICRKFARDEVMVAERLVSLGRRNSAGRIAFLLIEMGHRLQAAGFGRVCEYECPLSQQVMADSCGITPIHFNRTVADLRKKGLLSMEGGRVLLKRLPELLAMSAFDPAYLGLDRDRFGLS